MLQYLACKLTLGALVLHYMWNGLSHDAKLVKNLGQA